MAPSEDPGKGKAPGAVVVLAETVLADTVDIEKELGPTVRTCTEFTSMDAGVSTGTRVSKADIEAKAPGPKGQTKGDLS